MNKPTTPYSKIKKSDHIFAVKVKTESKGLGVIKTLVILLLIVIQFAILLLSNLYFVNIYRGFAIISIILTAITCIHALSSDYHGQAKATWIFFMIPCFTFGYIIYFLSDKRILFAKSKKKYVKIFNKTQSLTKQSDLVNIKDSDVKSNCYYLYNSGNFVTYTNSLTTYFPSGAQFFDDVLDEIKKAKKFIFMEFFIISDGVLLNRFLKVLSEKVKEGVDVRVIDDDMGSHSTLSRRKRKEMRKCGIKLVDFNRLIPVFNIALNLRDHRKIVVVDGKVGFTGGTNLADEYINEKRMHGYWKDAGIKIVGKAVDNFTIAFLQQWEFLTQKEPDYNSFIGKSEDIQTDGVVTPFVSGPNYNFSIAQNIFASQISNAKERLYIMSPYFIPDETITNLIINKARSGVDVRIILPEIADKKFVYIVSRNNTEKLMEHGVKVYTMTSSFVHSKIVLTESSAIVGSINMDLRSFFQQFESAVFTSEKHTLKDIEKDFENTFAHSQEITPKTRKRNRASFRLIAGIFKLISPFM